MQGIEYVNYPQGNQFSGPNLDPGNFEDKNEILLFRPPRLVNLQLTQVKLVITLRLQ